MKNQPTSTCSAESGDSLLPLDGLDLKQLDSATTNPTHKPSSKSIGRMSQSTETSKHSMERHIEESLFSQEDFPASRSVMPGSEEARTMTAISGRKCSESYKRQGQLGLLVRMLLESSAWHSTKCVLTWKQKVTKSSRSLFQLAVSMPRTEETEYGLLRGGGRCGRLQEHQAEGQTTRRNACGHRDTEEQQISWVLFWPTPKANKVHPMITDQNRQKLSSRNKANLEEVIAGNCGKATGQLNPAWVEWLMGYPMGWTELKDWATPSCRKSHIKSSKALQNS